MKTKNQLTVERRDTTEMLMKRRKREMWMQGTKREMLLHRMNANAEAQQSEPPRQPRRRKRTVIRWPNDKLTITELTSTRIPIGKRAHIRMRRMIGLIAR
jgi:hypothetical protein